jgi:hypothetical protein
MGRPCEVYLLVDVEDVAVGPIVASPFPPSHGRERRQLGRQCSDFTPIFIGMHRNAPLSPMREGARVHHSYGSYAFSIYGSYAPRRANPSTAWPRRCKLAHAFLWGDSYKRLKLAQLLGQLGVFLTDGARCEALLTSRPCIFCL